MNIRKLAKEIASKIEAHYRCHGINIKLRPHSFLKDCQRFIFQVFLMAGTKVDGIFERAADIQAALQIPLFQPFRKGVQIFLAVSMVPVGEVSLWRMLTSPAFRNNDKTLPVALGNDLTGEMVIEDLDKMVHAMYVGAPGSGKSTGLMCLILSLTCTHPASEVNLIIFDIGDFSLDVLEGIPHLSYPIVKDKDEGVYVIQALKDEMERRYGLEDSHRHDLPTIVCVMDEFNSFIGSIGSNRQEVVDNISNLLRRGRKAKIRFVLATQEPKNQKMAVEIGNITSRMAFKVTRFQTSVAILNCSGAEKLPGKGALLYQSQEYPEPIYVQGAYISDNETAQLVERIKAAEQDLSNKFVISEAATSDFPALLNVPSDTVQADSETEQEFTGIILWTLQHEEISVEKIKRSFSMGNRANGIIDKLCEAGLVSEKDFNKPRRVLPHCVENVPDAIMKFLARWGVTVEDVANAISKRTCSDPASCE